MTIEAIPGNDYSFSRWSDNEGLATRTITVNSDISLSATFGIGDYNIGGKPHYKTDSPVINDGSQGIMYYRESHK